MRPPGSPEELRDQVRLYFRLYPGKEVDADRSIAFLKELDRELDANWCLLWDRPNAHRANKTRAYLDTASRLFTFFLPAYAPELNPGEYLWGWLKMNPMANRAIHDVGPLTIVTRKSARSLQYKQELLRSFIQKSPLSLRLR